MAHASKLSRSIAMASLVTTFATTASPTLAASLDLAMRGKPIADVVRSARPKPASRKSERRETTILACESQIEGIAWACPGVALPATPTTLTYRVTLPD